MGGWRRELGADVGQNNRGGLRSLADKMINSSHEVLEREVSDLHNLWSSLQMGKTIPAKPEAKLEWWPEPEQCKTWHT